MGEGSQYVIGKQIAVQLQIFSCLKSLNLRIESLLTMALVWVLDIHILTIQ